jgi:hypothetical protein
LQMWETRILFQGYPHCIIYNNIKLEDNQIGPVGVIFVVWL